MLKLLQGYHPIFFLIVATALEVCGDALVRQGIYTHAGWMRLGVFLVGAALLFGYGFSLNLAPLEFGQVVGLYIATLFVMWQLINYLTFKTLPTLPIIVGGVFIIAGGLIVSFWKTGEPPHAAAQTHTEKLAELGACKDNDV